MTFSQRAVEAAARALCVQSGDDPDKLTYAHAMQCTGHDRGPKFTWQYWTSFAQAAITALTAALAVDGVALQGWQDISTAPKDGDPLLLGWPRFHPLVGHDECGVWGQLNSDFGFEPFKTAPTHWMALPPPPAASEGEERNSPPQDKP